MRVLAIREPGDETVLAIAERPDPEPAAHHVRVRVHYAGVNRADLLQRMGLYPAPTGVPSDVPGLEYSGVIDAVGSEVATLRAGDRVYGIVGGGAYAERIVVHEREAARIPESLSYEQAAAVPEAFITAYDALVLRGGLRPGERVLIHAIGSGVGTAGLQVAKALGCYVAGTSRTQSKIDRAKELALDVGVVVDDPRRLVALLESEAPQRFDVVLDLVGGAYTSATLAALASRGRLVVVGLTGGAHAEVDLRTLLTKRLTLVGTVLRSRPLEEKIQAADLLRRTLSPWLSRGMIKPVVERVLSLEEGPEAHRLLASNATFGKVLLRVT